MIVNSYYLRNIVFWGISSILCDIGLPTQVVFLLWDFLSACLLIVARKNLNLPYYFIPLFIVSFIGVLGLQNVYRQYLSTIFFLYSISLLEKSRFMTIATYITSILIHSSAIIFAGVYLLVWSKHKMSSGTYLAFLIFSAMLYVSFVGLRDDQMSRTTGSNMSLAYLVVEICIVVASLVTYLSLTTLNRRRHTIDIRVLLYLFLLNFLSYRSFGSNLYYERISMLLLPLTIAILTRMIDVYRQRRSLALLLSIGLSLPTFLFSSPMLYINNDPSTIF